MQPGEAGRLLRLARDLDRELTETAAALSDGTISVEHAQAIADAIRTLPAETPTETRIAAERELVRHSCTFTPDEVALLGRRVLDDVADPDSGVRDDRTHGQRMADALVELGERAARRGPAGQRRRTTHPHRHHAV
ncbi:MAG TPA: DUF222 domain-containing protein [Mycobacteriales bacterium]|nr:DUF222 domain-containing protein [Mycobacteriales bacterium]